MARKGNVAKTKNLKDTSGLLAEFIDELCEKGTARLLHVGRFNVIEKPAGKRYDFIKRKVVSGGKPYKQITFVPAAGIRDMLRGNKMKASH